MYAYILIRIHSAINSVRLRKIFWVNFCYDACHGSRLISNWRKWHHFFRRNAENGFMMIIAENKIFAFRLSCSGVQIIMLNDHLKFPVLWYALYIRYGFPRHERLWLHAMKGLRFIRSDFAYLISCVWESFCQKVETNSPESRETSFASLIIQFQP